MNFSRKHIVMSLLTVVAAVVLVSVLAWTALKPINAKNGFTRNLISTEVELLSLVPKPMGVTEFAGFRNEQVIFKTVDPATLFVMDDDLQAKKPINLSFPPIDKKDFSFSCFVDSASITTFSGNARTIIQYDDQHNSMLFKFPSKLFTKSVKISKDNYIFRVFEKADQIFAKGNPTTGSLIKEVNISEKHKDAGISTDGMLHYDKTNNGVVYIYYHRNEFLYLDTNLNLVYKGNTIDTLTDAKIGTAELKGDLMTSNTPKRFSNATNTVADGYLYNYSRLAADNEQQEVFTQNASIDVYKLASGKYIGSFYIPNKEGEKLYKLRVKGNKVYVLYQKNIAVYKLNLPTIQ